MPQLQYRKAEFQHLCKLYRYRYCKLARGIDVPKNSPVSVEIFDALDMLTVPELAEIVTIYLLGHTAQWTNYREAHQYALQLGFAAVTLLHSEPQLHKALQQGLSRLETDGEVIWME
ncbi:MAG: hypothetical protein AAF974_11380 [Cyanobacteria bacterium P01_E01_bin.34]